MSTEQGRGAFLGMGGYVAEASDFRARPDPAPSPLGWCYAAGGGISQLCLIGVACVRPMEETSITLALLSGAAGAIIATVLQQALSFWTERVKLRGETALIAVGWGDDVYLRLVDMATQKRAAYS